MTSSETTINKVASVKIIDNGIWCDLKIYSMSLTYTNMCTSKSEIRIKLDDVIKFNLWKGTEFYGRSFYNRRGQFIRDEYSFDKKVTKEDCELAKKMQLNYRQVI